MFWATIKKILVVGSMGIVNLTTNFFWVIPKNFPKHIKNFSIVNYGDQKLAIEIFWSPNLVTRNLKSGCQSCGN